MLRFTAAIVCATLAFIASSERFAQSVIYAGIASDGTMRIVGRVVRPLPFHASEANVVCFIVPSPCHPSASL